MKKLALKLNIQKTKIMASGSIKFMANRRGKVESVTDFIFLGSKITADGNATKKLKEAFSLEEKL